MADVGLWMMVVGFVGSIGAQLWTAVCAVRDDDIVACLMCLFVPGYIIWYGRRYERGALYVWLASLGLVVLGTAFMT